MLIPDEAASECDKGYVQRACHLDAAPDQVDAALASRQVGAHQRRFVRSGGREEVRSRRHAGGLQGYPAELLPKTLERTRCQVEWIELVAVTRKLNTGVSRLMNGIDCSPKRQLSQPEGAVA